MLLAKKKKVDALGGHCKNLAPEWEKAATNLKGIVKIGAINCDEEENKPLAGKYGIQGACPLHSFDCSCNCYYRREKCE